MDTKLDPYRASLESVSVNFLFVEQFDLYILKLEFFEKMLHPGKKIGPQCVHVWLTGYTCNLDKT